MTHRGCGKLPPRLAVREPRARLLGGNEWVGDPPRTTHRMHRHKHRHEPTNKTQGPSAMAHRPSDESYHTSAHQRRILPKSGYERRQFARSNCTVVHTVSFLRHRLCCLLSLQSAGSTAVPACKLQRCRPKTGGKRLIYGFALMQTASRAWNIPPSPSRTAAQHNQSQPY